MSYDQMGFPKLPKTGYQRRQHSCLKCGRSFSSISNLRRHERNIHHEEPIRKHSIISYKCPLCDIIMEKKISITKHQIHEHEIEFKSLVYLPVYPCFMCSQVFDNKYRLNEHKKSKHTGNTENDVEFVVLTCNECGDTFTSKACLRKHLWNIHFSNVREYELLKKVIPDYNCSINVIEYRVTNEDHGQFVANFNIKLQDGLAIDKWISDYQFKNKILFRKCSVHRSMNPNLVYCKKLRCHHHGLSVLKIKENVGNEQENCTAVLQLKLFSVGGNKSKNYTYVKLSHTHNHPLESDMKIRRPTEETKRKFTQMFWSGLTPTQAVRQNLEDLEYEYGSQFKDIASDRGLCPTLSWAYSYRNSCMKNVDNSGNFKTENTCSENIHDRSQLIIDGSNIFKFKKNTSVILLSNNINVPSQPQNNELILPSSDFLVPVTDNFEHVKKTLEKHEKMNI